MKSKEENEFLSYVHMAASLFREYAKKSNVLEVKNFLNVIIEKLSKHEEEVKESMEITKNGNELSMMQNMVLCMNKMKINMMKNCFEICIEALKTVDMAIYQISRFIKKNKNVVRKDFLDKSIFVLKEYDKIGNEIRKFIFSHYLFD